MADDVVSEAGTLTTELSCEEETLWENLHAPATAVPFVECADSLSSVTRHAGHRDVRALQQRAIDIARRHTVLQSCFPSRNSGAVRLTVPERDDGVRLIDLRHLPDDERERHAAAVANAELCEPFDIARGPLCRIAVITLRDDDHVLSVAAHHLVVDGRSVGIIHHEMRAGLDAPPAALPPPSSSYSDYVAWQQRQAAGPRWERLRTFWLRKLEGVMDRRMTAAREADVGSSRARYVRFSVGVDESTALRRFSQSRRVSIATAMVALLTIVVHERTDSTDVVIGMPVSSRLTSQVQNTVGLFLNLVAVRADVSGDPSFVDLIGRVWSSAIEAYDHRAFPYEHLIRELGVRPGHAPPPFRVVLNFTTPSTVTPALPGLVGSEAPATRTSPSLADVSFHVADCGSSLDCCLLYKADLFSDSTIADLAARLQRLAGEVARDPNRPISRLIPR